MALSLDLEEDLISAVKCLSLFRMDLTMSIDFSGFQSYQNERKEDQRGG